MNHSISEAHHLMIEQQLRTWHVLNNTLLDEVAKIDRQDFLPASHQAFAYMDTDVPIGYEQMMLSPKVQARMVQDLALTAEDTVLEIGTGTGYSTALMARLARSVKSLEIVPELANFAMQAVRPYAPNAEVIHADGVNFVANEDLNFSVIVLSGAIAKLPIGILEEMPLNARLFAIIGEEPMMRATLVKRIHVAANFDRNHFQLEEPWDTCAPYLRGFEPKPGEGLFD